MTTPIPDAIRIPQSFSSAHLTQHQLARRLGMTEPQFWAAYLEGAIPPGVPMLELIGFPLMAWPTADIEQWERAGCPLHAELADRTKRVLTALREAIEATYGESLESLAETITSRN